MKCGCFNVLGTSFLSISHPCPLLKRSQTICALNLVLLSHLYLCKPDAGSSSPGTCVGRAVLRWNLGIRPPVTPDLFWFDVQSKSLAFLVACHWLQRFKRSWLEMPSLILQEPVSENDQFCCSQAGSCVFPSPSWWVLVNEDTPEDGVRLSRGMTGVKDQVPSDLNTGIFMWAKIRRACCCAAILHLSALMSRGVSMAGSAQRLQEKRSMNHA